MTGRLSGKVALVTGSTRGIGAGTAKMFAAEGAKVVVTGRTAADGAKVVDAIRRAGGEASFVPLDISSEESVQACVDRTMAIYGALAILVNNATPNDLITGAGSAGGTFADRIEGSVTELTTENWRKITAHGIDGLFWMLKYGIKAMQQSGGGSIVNISSIASIQGLAGFDAYCAGKGAMNALTRTVAVTYAPQIRCNAILVGGVATEGGTTLTADPKLAEAYEMKQLTGWLGKPEHIAHAATFLASDEAAYLTGQLIPVDGGASVPGLTWMVRRLYG
jgi:NAD(P)-dependent dehydrogenase (short-subunit alcohol dehydrogenase family)